MMQEESIPIERLSHTRAAAPPYVKDPRKRI